MGILLLLARLLLAAVFVVAGLAKLADRKGSRQAMRDFGVPSRLAGPLGILLPIAELVVAVALIPTATAWWGALGALTLLLLFVAGIGLNLARGKRPDCHCFGQLHSAPAGWPTLARNGALAAVAAFILWQGWDDPGRSAVAGLDGLTAAGWIALTVGLVALAALAVVGWTVVHLLGQQGRLLVRLEAVEAQLASAGIVAPAAVPTEAAPERGLPVGSPAPAFSLAGLHGETLTLDALRAGGKPQLLVFSDPNCGPCNSLLPDLGRWQREQGDRLPVTLISRGTAAANRAKTSKHGLTHVLLQQDREVAEAYLATGTPAAVVVSPDGKIDSPLALGTDAIRALHANTTGTPAPAPVPARAPTPTPAPQAVPAANGNGVDSANGASAPARIGSRAPSLTFPDLDGRPTRLASFRGSPTLVLFWNPGCGFCSRMLDDLKAWEADPPEGAPKLLLISTGDAETNRAMGLQAPVVLDQSFDAGRAFGVSGTPSAILLDARGRIASQVAVGAPAVLKLARGEAPGAAAPRGNGTAARAKPAVGDPAPPIELPNLDGERLSLAQLSGTRTLVLFWNPSCGYCRRMIDDLKAWEAKPPKGSPKLLVVSRGTAEANRAMGLRSPVLLDEGIATMTAFGATGTPSAVLVDARGRIASELAVGAAAVLALAEAKDGTRAEAKPQAD